MKKLLNGLLFAVALAAPHAYAGLIQTEGSERERVMTMVERPEVAQTLEKMGIAADQAKARVGAMTEAEVHSLAGKLDALPAGGALGTQDFLLIVIIVILLVVLL